jgi:hypothetical protein
VPAYRFYTINKDGHVVGPPATHELPADRDAVQEANKIIDGNDIEIWQGARLIAYVTPEEKRPWRRGMNFI